MIFVGRALVSSESVDGTPQNSFVPVSGSENVTNRLPKTGTDKMKTKHQPNPVLLSAAFILAATLSNTAAGQETAAGQNNETPAAVVVQADWTPEKILVKANSEFAFDLYAQLAKTKEGENLFFSPYSINNALLMIAEGARGKTALEMGNVLRFPKSLLHPREETETQETPWKMSVMRAGQSKLNQWIGEKQNSAIILNNANAVWCDRSFKILEPWQKTVTGSYGADAIQRADFRRQSGLEVDRINAWVSKQTQGQIEDLFSASDFSSSTRMVLANAIYFKGDWLTPFNAGLTKVQPFQLTSGKETKVPMMHKSGDTMARYAAFNSDGTAFKTPRTPSHGGKGPAEYPDKDGFAMVEMPYQGGGISMVIIAPNDPAGFRALEQRISAANLNQWIAALDFRETEIFLPKFKMEEKSSLREALQTMGMSSAFHSETSDFSGIGEAKEFSLKEIIHKGVIEVNEKGTEAAAATGAAIDSAPQFIPSFKADRPFIFLIRDVERGAILFLGRMMNP